MSRCDGYEPGGDLRPPSLNVDAKTTLLGFLDYLQDAVAATAVGVPEPDGRAPGVPSGTSILGLVKHLTAVEINWLGLAYAGADIALQDGDAQPAAGETPDDLIDAYREAARRFNEIVAALPRSDVPGAPSLRETPPPLMRWALVHMVEETVRHAGYAGILGEQFDGSADRSALSGSAGSELAEAVPFRELRCRHAHDDQVMVASGEEFVVAQSTFGDEAGLVVQRERRGVVGADSRFALVVAAFAEHEAEQEHDRVGRVSPPLVAGTASALSSGRPVAGGDWTSRFARSAVGPSTDRHRPAGQIRDRHRIYSPDWAVKSG
ncbi:DinB family protein [Saccharopolyspora sp. NPDC000995]